MTAVPHGRRCWWRPGLLLSVALLLFIVPVLLSLRSVPWQLNLTASTEVLRLKLLDAQTWQVGNAILCVQGQRGENGPLLLAPGGICGGKQWRQLDIQSVPGELILNLTASATAPIDVQIDTFRSGEMRMALRQEGSADSLGSVGSEGNAAALGTLGRQANLVWPSITPEQAKQLDSGGVAVLPFSGAITVGRDVSWSTQRMLLAGEIAVFSASESHLAGRTVAERSELTLGDRVDIIATDRPTGTPKGFLRLNRAAAPPEGSNVVDVVVYAPAEQATIHRFGGGDYRFEAGWWVRLKHQSGLVILLLVFTGVLSIFSSLVSIIPACRRLIDWCRAGEGKPPSGVDARNADAGTPR